MFTSLFINILLCPCLVRLIIKLKKLRLELELVF